MNTRRTRQHSRGSTAGDATRLSVLEATLEVIRTEGIVGASARAIARQADVNQASIYYHFGSINGAVIAAVRHMSNERLAEYEQLLLGVDSLPELVDVAAKLHREDTASGNLTVLSQTMAGAVGDDELGPALAEIFEPWITTVANALRRVLPPSPIVDALPIDDLSAVISALFLGIDLLTQLGGEEGSDRGERSFAAVSGIAYLVDTLLRNGFEIPGVAEE